MSAHICIGCGNTPGPTCNHRRRLCLTCCQVECWEDETA